ncbi:MAG: hypothetical protein AAF596_09680 [Planctomycetota bacterium]
MLRKTLFARQNTLLFALAASGVILPSAAPGEGIPKVLLSEQHKAMCKVGVGDTLPFKRPIAGKAATVLVLVEGDGWMTRQLLKDVGPDVSKPFRDKGVEPIAMFVREQAKQSDDYTALADPAGKDFSKLGSGALPRVYVLDADSKIVWFDIEYVRSTRRELRQTLEALTAK